MRSFWIRSRAAASSTFRYSRRDVTSVLAVLQVLVSFALVTLVLMHSGRDTGFGGMGFTPASQGGTHIVERNLTRLTVAVGIIFVVTTILLYRQLA
jgi:preprotein translocase subunit SecG